MPKLRNAIKEAIKSGPVPKLRKYDDIVDDPQTLGERVIAFAHHYLVVPEGSHVGQPMRLEDFQCAFVLALFDNPEKTRHAYYSVARRNGKTMLVSCIICSYIVGPAAEQNSTIVAAAMSRDQAGITYKMISRMMDMSPKLQGLYKTIPSKKEIIGFAKGTEFKAIAHEARTGFGQGMRVVLLDEAGQIKGAASDFADMLTTSQGSEKDPVMITISTQAPSDVDYLSIHLDAAERGNNPRTVSHVYKADEDADLLDKKQWKKANPGLGIFRSFEDLEEQLIEANNLPSKEASARNLLLNQRVARDRLFMTPKIWKRNNGSINIEAFRSGAPVCVGLDLSQRADLTAAVAAVQDPEGVVHLLPFGFCPSNGIEDRAKRDRAPYDVWARNGQLILVGSESMDYKEVASYLRDWFSENDIEISVVAFDRWRIELFKEVSEQVSFATWAEWKPIGQGYKDMSPCCEAFQNLALEGKIRHGNHPVLNMAASNAIVVSDPAGSIKLDKSKSTQRIDPLVAAVMAVFEVSDGQTEGFGNDLSYWVA